MTQNERDLLTLIRENENPAQALLTAVIIIGRSLEQPVSYPTPFVDFPREHA